MILEKSTDRDLSHDLGEIDRSRPEPKFDKSKLRVMHGALLHNSLDHVPCAKHVGRRRLLLDEAHLARRLRQGERLLEEVQRIVVVQDLDRLADSGDLFKKTL